MNKVKKFGFWSIVLLTINAVIGTGIFLSPAGVITTVGTYTPLVYILAALFAAILAITFASAAKYVTTNGAAYAYAKAAFGDTVGFYVGITRFAAGAIAWGVMATAVVRTTLGIFGGPSAVTKSNITLGFLILMAILLGIVFSGTYITKVASNISTVGKVAALVVAIVAGLVIWLTSGANHFNDITTMMLPNGEPVVKPLDVTIFVGAMLSAFYAYTGFESVASAASEMVDPEKNLPRAIPLGIAIIALIYVGVVSITMVINPTGVVFSKEPVILASAFTNPIIKNAIVYGAVISMFGINIAAAFSTPRIFEAMADAGQLPQVLRKRTKQNVPIYAFLITAIMAIFVPMAFQYDMKGIMIISSVSRFIQFLVVPWAVVSFYKNKSKEPILTPARKSVLTDVIIPIIAFFTSAFLLYKFNWAGQFSMKDASGATVTNYYAIWAMVIGYVILPLVLFIPYKMGMYEKK
ncbi:hypothetical protein ABB02_00233 [Clostridiaceae bacterium JG1575]|nr:hypothetical protein ABB02_00233 [Clostridiaceae bacterium JG1575]